MEFDINNLKKGQRVEQGRTNGRIYIFEDEECIGAGCNACGRVLHTSQFNNNIGNKHRIASNCRECTKELYRSTATAVVYRINFPEINAVYIGQSTNLKHRLTSHMTTAKAQSHGVKLFNMLAHSYPEYFWNVFTYNVEILKTFEGDNVKDSMTYFEYTEQLNHLSDGYLVLGNQKTDRQFSYWLLGNRGIKGKAEILAKFQQVEEKIMEIMKNL